MPGPFEDRHRAAAFFDGSSNHQTVRLPYAIELRSFTVSAWFRIDGYDSDYTGGNEYYMVFSSGRFGNAGIPNFAGGGISFFYSGMIVGIQGSEGSVGTALHWDVRSFRGTGEWHHVAVTYDEGQGIARVYGDGDEKDSVAVTLGAVRPYNNAGLTVPYFIGSKAEKYFNGGVDDLHIWNRALAPDEIQAIHQGLIGHWKLDEPTFDGTPGEVKDSSHSRRYFDGQAHGATSIASGHSGRAASFDGVDDEIELEMADELQTFSVAAWFRIDGPPSQGTNYLAMASVDLGTSGLSNFSGDGIGFFFAGGVININGTDGNTNTSLWWDVRPFEGDNEWHHIVVTYDGSTACVYGDGGIKDTMVVNLGTVSALGWQGRSGLYYLGSRGPDSDMFFNGAVDDVKMWDRALDLTEVQYEYAH